MKTRNVVAIILIAIVLIAAIFYFVLGRNKVIENPDGLRVVKISGGNSMLIAECANLSYREDTSDYIIKGFAKTTDVGWNENKTHIITNQEFKISEYLKGQSFGDTLLIQRFGGCVAGICEGVEEGGAYEEDREIILYLQEINGELVRVC